MAELQLRREFTPLNPPQGVVSLPHFRLPASPWRDALLVFAWALGIRLIFAALTADSYDQDEFVVLALSHSFAHGAVPYSGFTFFHPPGILVFFRVLQPLVDLWWPFARLSMALIDSLTAVVVWRIGLTLYGRRESLAAGLLYGVSPIAVLAGVRVGQDTIITALGLTGLLCLLAMRSRWGAVLAGVCLGLAIWFKYPAALLLPVYLLAAPRRALLVLAITGVTVAGLFVPFSAQFHALYLDTVIWQMLYRPHAALLPRVGAVLAFWLLLNPIAVIAIPRWKGPRWVLVGFGMGALFVLTAEAYYHYFVPVVPFAALLSGPLVAAALRRAPRITLGLGLAAVAGWAAGLDLGPLQPASGASQLSSANRAVAVVDRVTDRHQRILGDGLEYAYLARRPQVGAYFWDMEHVVNARSLESRLHDTGAVVATRNVQSPYPAGFLAYLNHHGYKKIHTAGATIWLVGE